MKKRLRIIIPLILIIAAGIALYSYFNPEKNNGTLKVSGTIEATETQLSFRIPGVLTARFVDEGDSVTCNKIILCIQG